MDHQRKGNSFEAATHAAFAVLGVLALLVTCVPTGASRVSDRPIPFNEQKQKCMDRVMDKLAELETPLATILAIGCKNKHIRDRRRERIYTH